MVSGSKQPLIAIVGPTASGKTDLSIDLAERFDGEIICADSRTIYKGMDIGTAKPTISERRGIPHWGIDLVNPGEYFTVADFKKYADKKISEIRSRNRVPFMVGGSGLYIDAVLFDYQFGSSIDESLRFKLNQLSLEQLYEYCLTNNIRLPENYKNKRYVIRAIEQGNHKLKRSNKLIDDAFIVGISTEQKILQARIRQRSEQMFSHGVVEEATMLSKKYGWDNEAMSGIIYRIVHKYLMGDISLDEAVDKLATADWQLVKKQLTWFRRNTFIRWLSLIEARLYISQRLAINM